MSSHDVPDRADVPASATGPAADVPPARASGRPYRVGLVCLGNICRSPMAEVVLRARLTSAGLGEAVEVDSFGLGPWHVGRPMDPRAYAALAELGHDGSRHRARQVTRAEVAARDLVLAMDDDNLLALRRLAPAEERDDGRIRLFGSYAGPDGGPVPDPYTGGPEQFAHVLTLVGAASDGLTTALAALLADDR